MRPVDGKQCRELFAGVRQVRGANVSVGAATLAFVYSRGNFVA